MKRSSALKALRMVVSAGIILYLVMKLDLGEIGMHLKNLKAAPLLLAAAADFLMIAGNSLRWKVLLRAKGIALPLPRLIYYYLVGIFFSAFLPTSVGGDFARVVAVASVTGRRADAFASVVVERLMGFFVLIPIYLVAMPFVAGGLADLRPLLVIGAVGLLIFLVAYLALLRPVARRISRLLDPLFNLFSRFRIREKLEKAYEAIVVYRGSRAAVVSGFALSVASRLLWVLGCYFVARAFSMEISFTTLLVVVPVVELARAIPISLSGIGVREAAFVALLGQFGVGENIAFAYGLVVYFVFFLFSIAGGILYAAGGLGRAAATPGGEPVE
ncbi:MAG: lysylphosphatidylglycerol synthase transmembrane domain-containing protein [bacterium]|jgi:uncharacterized protein (TIRG00374 family)